MTPSRSGPDLFAWIAAALVAWRRSRPDPARRNRRSAPRPLPK